MKRRKLRIASLAVQGVYFAASLAVCALCQLYAEPIGRDVVFHLVAALPFCL